MQNGTELDDPMDNRAEDQIVGRSVEKDLREWLTKDVREPIVDNGQTLKEKEEVEKEQPYIPPPPYKSHIPYP